MKTYQIYLKSHTDAPDYEDECRAESLKEASRTFAIRIANNSEDDWDPKDLEAEIEEVL